MLPLGTRLLLQDRGLQPQLLLVGQSETAAEEKLIENHPRHPLPPDVAPFPCWDLLTSESQC